MGHPTDEERERAVNQTNGKQEHMAQRVEILAPIKQDAPPTDADLLAIIERRNQMLERILDYAIRATHAGQWVDQQGKPWPTAAAAEVMARRCAVSVRNVQSNKVPSSDDKGPFYMYVVTATASLPGGYDAIESMGTCSSRDTFLGTQTREGRPLSEIDEGNILKAAYSNMLVNAITRLLGVRNLTWEQLITMGISPDGAAKVTFNSGSRGGGSSADPALEPLKFGKSKGKTFAELADADLAWYVGCFERDIADPEKAKFKAPTEKKLAAAKAEQAKRATNKTPWQQIQELGATGGMDTKAIGAQVKALTGKTKTSELSAEDVAKFKAWVEDVPSHDDL